MSKSRDAADWARFQPQRKNIIINGGMSVWQRGTTIAGISGLSGVTYVADRWLINPSSTAAVATISSSTNVPDSVNGTSLQVDVTTADATVGSTDLYIITQRIEGYNIRGTLFGNAAAKDLTLSFWVQSPKTGIHSGAILNGDRNRSYTFEYTVDVADTWQKFEITIPGDTTGTWDIDNTEGMGVRFALMAGSLFTQAPGSWGTGDKVGTSNQVNVMDDVANNFRLTEVQLEVGTEATDFEYRHIGDELALCQRYYQQYTLLGLAGFANGTTIVETGFQFPTSMRDAPTLTTDGTVGKWYTPGGTDTSSSSVLTQMGTTEQGAWFRFNGWTGLTSTEAGIFDMNGNEVELDAEL